MLHPYYDVTVYDTGRVEQETIRNLSCPQVTAIAGMLDRLEIVYTIRPM